MQEQKESSIDDEQRALYTRLQPTGCTIKSLAVYAVDTCFILVTATDDEQRALYTRLQPTGCTIKSLAVYAVVTCFILVTATVRVIGNY